jgi:hypothetical protein
LFSGPSGLPVYEIDDDIYEKPPSFLIGTVDKFAMLAWQERARKIFGIGDSGKREYAPPESAWVSWRLPNLEISRHLGLI